MNESSENYSIRPLFIANALALPFPSEDMDILLDANMLQEHLDELHSYILKHNAKAIGQLIMKASIKHDEDNRRRFFVDFMTQIDCHIKSVDGPFKMEEAVSVPNCLYIKYIGSEIELLQKCFELRTKAKMDGVHLNLELYMVFLSRIRNNGVVKVEIYMPLSQQ